MPFSPTIMSSLNKYLEKSLETIKKAHWYRQEQTITSLAGAVIELEGKELINFASNDYLGLASDSRLINAAQNVIVDVHLKVVNLYCLCHI